MRAKIFFITLAVDDLDRSVGFYRDGLGWPTEGIVGREFHDEITGADGTIAIFTRRRPADHAVRTHQPGQGRESAGRAAQLDRVQPGYPRPVADGGRQAARPGRSRWRHADSTRAYAPVWRLLRVLHRSRWSSLRNRLELQRVGLVGGSFVHASAARLHGLARPVRVRHGGPSPDGQDGRGFDVPAEDCSGWISHPPDDRQRRRGCATWGGGTGVAAGQHHQPVTMYSANSRLPTAAVMWWRV